MTDAIACSILVGTVILAVVAVVIAMIYDDYKEKKAKKLLSTKYAVIMDYINKYKEKNKQENNFYYDVISPLEETEAEQREKIHKALPEELPKIYETIRLQLEPLAIYKPVHKSMIEELKEIEKIIDNCIEMIPNKRDKKKIRWILSWLM